VPSRTHIVCLHEGKKGRSIDPVFIRTLIKTIDPAWVRPWPGNNVIRPIDCGGRNSLIERTPTELRICLGMGADTTLMVWADVDDNMRDPNQLRDAFWERARREGIAREQFDQIIFIFARDRLENWIEFLLTGTTDETTEGPRQKHDKAVADAARVLAQRCKNQGGGPPLPASLSWSCQNWRSLVERMQH
jgi:hypothetical protein